MSVRSLALGGGTVLLLLLGAAGCGSQPAAAPDEIVAETSPSGKWKAKLRLYRDRRVDLIVETPGAPAITVRDQSFSDFDLCFVDISWSSDSRLLASVVRNCADTQLILDGFDVAARKPVEWSAVEEQARASLRGKYSIRRGMQDAQDLINPGDVDPVQWVNSPEARSAWQNRFTVSPSLSR